MAKIRSTGVTELGSLDLGTPLAVVDGGSGVTVSRQLAQIVTYQTGAVATGTTVIPYDDTIPQNTEGDQYMSLSITPTNINSSLEVDVQVNLTGTVWGTNGGCVALFKDSTASALATVFDSLANNTLHQVKIHHILTAGTTSLVTFKVRAGMGAAGTTTFNGASGGGVGGGTLASRITIKEYLP